MKWTIFFSLVIFFVSLINPAYSEGFTADFVDIMRMNNGKIRVIVKYTNVEIGEYRESHIDFTSKKEAIAVFQKLVKGATFFWGDGGKIAFKGGPEKALPY